MTGYVVGGFPEERLARMLRNAKKVVYVARTSGISSVLFTGKGEPYVGMAFITY